MYNKAGQRFTAQYDQLLLVEGVIELSLYSWSSNCERRVGPP